MKARTRITIALAISLVVAGALALVVHSTAFRSTEYPAWDAYRDELLTEMDVSREGVIAALDEDPALLFDAPAADPEFGNGTSIDDASRAVQQRAMDRAAARSLRWAAATFATVTVASVVAAWLLAGRILRPIRLVTSRAQTASADDLSGRVALDGPDDEVKELADTFDAMLDRIEASFETQRRFSAQVAHELRTPLSVTRSEVDMLRDDVGEPGLRARLDSVAEATGRAERLVTRLHLLSRTRRGDLRRESFAFDELVGNVVGRLVDAAEWRQVQIDLDLAPAQVVGDRALLESLVRNLVDNAGRHNRPGGWVRVAARPTGDGAELEVANSVNDAAGRVNARSGHDRSEPVRRSAPLGAIAPESPAAAGVGDATGQRGTHVDAATVDGMTTPDVCCRRLPGAANVGLTIVDAVVGAHRGTIAWRALPPGADDVGGVDLVIVRVRLPATIDSARGDRIAAAMQPRPGGSA
jgi:signal transduction histidine kinase